MSTRNRPIKILLVEDNPGDVRLAQEALRESQIRTNVQVAVDGEEALALLRRTLGLSTQAIIWEENLPDLILLDLNLPKKNGTDVLTEIKADVALMHIPVIVLTTSTAREDVYRAYQLHANCYISKPIDVMQFFQVMKLIEDFWLKTVNLPS